MGLYRVNLAILVYSYNAREAISYILDTSYQEHDPGCYIIDYSLFVQYERLYGIAQGISQTTGTSLLGLFSAAYNVYRTIYELTRHQKD